MTDDLVTAVSSLSHDGEFNSLGRRTKEPPDLQTTLSRASQRNKSIRSRETRDMSEELNSRAQSERQGIVNESDVGYSAQLSQQNVQRLRDIYEGDLLL